MVIKTCISEKRKQSAGQFAVLSALTLLLLALTTQVSPEKMKGIKAPLIPSAIGPALRGERVHFERVGEAFQGSSRKPLLGLCCDDHIFSLLFNFCTLRVHKFP